MIRDFLKDISEGLSEGVPSYLKDHPLAKKIRQDGPELFGSQLTGTHLDFDIKGSAGQGQWADIPWIAFLNPSVTDRASQGYYVVYLFQSNSNKIILGLAQSFEEAEKEFKKDSKDVLDKQAEIMRKKIPEYAKDFKSSIPEIEVSGSLNYRHGHVYHLEYDSNSLPAEEILEKDLKMMLDAYETLFYRGGRDSDNFSVNDQDTPEKEITIEETYRKKVHAQIERPSNAKIKQLKNKLGYICQCCGFDFEKKYGEIGKDFIEAHHLTAISNLKKGETRKTTDKDFAMLCSNCHRMIHRLEDSSDMEKLKSIIGNNDR